MNNCSYTVSWFDPFIQTIFINKKHSEVIDALNFFLVKKESDEKANKVSYNGIKSPDDRGTISNAKYIEYCKTFVQYQHELFHLRHITSLPLALTLWNIESFRMFLSQSFFSHYYKHKPNAKFLYPIISKHSGEKLIRESPPYLAEKYSHLFKAWTFSSNTLDFFAFGTVGFLPDALSQLIYTFDQISLMYNSLLKFNNNSAYWQFRESVGQRINCDFSTSRLLEFYTRIHDTNLIAALRLPQIINDTILEWHSTDTAKWLGTVSNKFQNLSLIKSLVALEIALMAPSHPYYLSLLEWSPTIHDIHPGSRFVKIMELIDNWSEPKLDHDELITFSKEVEKKLPWPTSNRIAQLSVELENTGLHEQRQYLGTSLLNRHIECSKLRCNDINPFFFPLSGLYKSPISDILAISEKPHIVYKDGSPCDDIELLWSAAQRAVLKVIMKGGDLYNVVSKYGIPQEHEDITDRLIMQMTNYSSNNFTLLERKDW